MYDYHCSPFLRQYIGRSTEPFAITLAGATFYIITDPQHVSEVYKNSSTLSFDIFLRNIMAEFGSSNSAINKIFRLPICFTEGKFSHEGKNTSQLAHDFQLRQTHGQDLKLLGKLVEKLFRKSLRPDQLDRFCVKNLAFGKHMPESIISLKTWTAEVFINAGQTAYFGCRLQEVDPTLSQALIRLDELSWQVFYQYPRVLRPELNRVSERIRKSLKMYFEMPIGERQAPTWFTQALETEYRKAGLDSEDIAAQMLFLYWG